VIVVPTLPPHLRRVKLGRAVLAPTGTAGDFDSEEVDCACVFMHEGAWLMAYAGWDGQCNRIGLARSQNLVDWGRVGLLLDLGESRAFDAGSVSGPFVFAWEGVYHLFYCGFPGQGYEAGPGAHGVALSTDLVNWERHPANPVMRPSPDLAWESAGLYKAFVMRDGDRFRMFYNAKSPDEGGGWRERTGTATSPDLLHWRKHEGNPVLDVGPPGSWDSRFASDPWVVMIGGVWHLFYYGFDGAHAQEGVATSPDLLHWTRSEFNPIIRSGRPGSIDAALAHKPCVIEHEGVWYHFYTAANGRRSIALATSEPLS
jgi:predicted GH43/DUF377 family glycosyl hydrolase